MNIIPCHSVHSVVNNLWSICVNIVIPDPDPGLRQTMFLQNEPNLMPDKITASNFINNTNDYSPATNDYISNPIRTQIVSSRTRFGKPNPPRFHPKNQNSDKSCNPVKRKSRISRQNPRTQFRPQVPPTRASRFQPRIADYVLKTTILVNPVILSKRNPVNHVKNPEPNLSPK